MRTQRDDDVATVVLDGPRTGNTLTGEAIDQLHRELDAAHAGSGLKAIVLRAHGETFCTGMDFTEAAQDAGPAAADGVSRFFDLLHRITTSSALVVAVVEGRAAGGGVGLVAAADLVIASPQAQFSLPEALWGILPCAVMPFLVRRIGFQRAYAMTISTLPVAAARAADIGLVDELADDPDRALRRLLDRVNRFAPGTVTAAKQYCAHFADPLSEPGAVERIRSHATTTFAQLAAAPVFRDAVEAYVRDGLFPWQAAPSPRS